MVEATVRSERILVVDRDPGVRADLSQRLARMGHSVVAASSRTEAETQFDLMDPTAVVADAELPREFFVALRGKPGGRTVPILALGSPDNGSRFESLLPLGHVWYTSRSSDFAHLERTFTTMMARTEVHGGGVAL